VLLDFVVVDKYALKVDSHVRGQPLQKVGDLTVDVGRIRGGWGARIAALQHCSAAASVVTGACELLEVANSAGTWYITAPSHSGDGVLTMPR
jgi:hypothetical protein